MDIANATVEYLKDTYGSRQAVPWGGVCVHRPQSLYGTAKSDMNAARLPSFLENNDSGIASQKPPLMFDEQDDFLSHNLVSW